ncbi:MAG TPA: GatB/YqeY domain-containing protein [Acidimicrobiia bacterium]|nr:GatB/YqeY domain-containing protein [Acidimicrobiia bacterium]
MTIKEELNAELKDAMKARDARRRDVIRMIETEVTLARSAPGFKGEVNDSLYRKVIAAYAKKMEKAKGEFREAGDRGAAMVEKLAWEVEYLSRWLPKKLDEESTAALVSAAIAELDVAGDPKASGRVIGQIMKEHKDEVDGALVNRLVAEALKEA